MNFAVDVAVFILKRFCFDPFRTVIGCYYYIFVSSACGGGFKRAYEIQATLLEWFQGPDRLVRHAVALISLSHPLTEITLLTKIMSILFCGRPAKSALLDFSGCGIACIMPAHDSMVSFPKYGVFLELSNRASPDVIRGFVIQHILE